MSSIQDPELRSFLEAALAAIEEGARSARHAFHLPALATLGPDGEPRLRTLVARDFRREAPAVLYVHTDLRSPKVAELEAQSACAWLFYDREGKLQVRARGHARVLRSGPIVEERWKASKPSARRCYLAPLAPGALTQDEEPNVPEEWRHTIPPLAASEAGRENFAVLATTLVELDILSLRHSGHRRAKAHVAQGEEASSQWRAAWCAV